MSTYILSRIYIKIIIAIIITNTIRAKTQINEKFAENISAQNTKKLSKSRIPQYIFYIIYNQIIIALIIKILG